MSRDLNDPTDRPEDGRPGRRSPSRRRITVRFAAVAGLSATVAVAVVGIAVAAPTPADRVRECVEQAATAAATEVVSLPAEERDAYVRRAVEAARTRCAALATSTATTSPTTATTSSTSSTTATSTTATSTRTSSTTATSTSTSTTTTSPAPRPARYEVVQTGVIGTGPQTLTASCDPGDQVVSYRYQVGNPTGSNPSRRVNASSDGRTVRLTYEVTGTVADQRTSLTVVCRRAS